MSVVRPNPESDPDESALTPRIHDLAAEVLTAAGARVPDARGGTVLAMAEAADPLAPPRLEAAGGACGGGRRVVLDGDAVILSDGERPTHLLVRAVDAVGSRLLVILERGERGVDPWPGDGITTAEVAFRSVRLDASGVVSGSSPP